ncbi:MAG: hypothetical protein SXG53_10145 [Pseudomonadota bacterium]|nr:hypothetical protein [Pseudomonadota bacterium]
MCDVEQFDAGPLTEAMVVAFEMIDGEQRLDQRPPFARTLRPDRSNTFIERAPVTDARQSSTARRCHQPATRGGGCDWRTPANTR